MNKTTKIKKILFYICLIPYIWILLQCIYYCFAGYGYELGKTAHGFVAITNFLGEAFGEVSFFLMDNLAFLILAIIWIGYQFYYLLTYKKESISKIEKRKKWNVKKILFILSITCWIIYFASGIYAFFFGSMTGGGLFNPTMEYGFAALTSTLFWNLLAFTYIPVLPITLIYIIIYLVINRKNKSKTAVFDERDK